MQGRNPVHCRVGDIVAAQVENGPSLVHRLIQLPTRGDTQLWVLKGDNSLTCDSPVVADQIIGVVTAVQRGDQLLDLQTPVARMIGQLVASLSRAEDRIARSSRHAGKMLPLKILHRTTWLVRKLSYPLLLRLQALPHWRRA